MFLRIRKRSLLFGFDLEENPEKGLRQWERASMKLKPEFVYFFYFRDRPKNGEGNKQRRRRKYTRQSN